MNRRVAKSRGSHLERREQAEARMIKAAVRIVAQRGLDSLTLAECGEAAGYSRGLAAHYFGSKDALVQAIATRIVSDYSQRLQQASMSAEEGLEELLQRISFYIGSGGKNLTRSRAFHAVLGASLKHSPLSAAIASLNRSSTATLAAIIQRGVEQGNIRRSVDPASQARLILASLRGVMTQKLLDPAGVSLASMERELLGTLRRGLAA